MSESGTAGGQLRRIREGWGNPAPTRERVAVSCWPGVALPAWTEDLSARQEGATAETGTAGRNVSSIVRQL